MFVSRTLDYALRSLIYLALRPNRVVSLKELSRSVRVSVPYLAKIMRNLVRSGIVHSDPGARGGYRLLRGPEEITLREIYEVMEGGFHTVECLLNPRICELVPTCTQLPLWQHLEREMQKILGEKSLKDCMPEGSYGFISEGRLQREKDWEEVGSSSPLSSKPYS